MRTRLMLVLVLCALVFMPYVVFTAEVENNQAAAAPVAQKLDSPEMNLEFEQPLPANFRGGDPDHSCVHVLEDQPYKRMEHTLLFEEEPQAMGATEGAKFDGPPTINWTTEEILPDGSVRTISNLNNNKATSESEFPEPGQYCVGNGGARQVSGLGGGVATTTPDPNATAAGGKDKGTDKDTQTDNGATTNAAADQAADTQRVTSTQTTGVICHDITSPNVWAVFQELAGNTQEALNEETLKKQLADKILAEKGIFDPTKLNDGALKGASLLAVSEFPLNQKPSEKTAVVGIKGPMFSEVGKDEIKTASTVKMKILDNDTQTRITEVKADKDLKGVYIRRNVPVVVSAVATDNGDHCTSVAETSYRIETKDGTEVEKVDNAYLFRVPNYPRSEYPDQPEYVFVMEGADKDGNKTVVKLPLYVVNTQMAVEGGRNE